MSIDPLEALKVLVELVSRAPKTTAETFGAQLAVDAIKEAIEPKQTEENELEKAAKAIKIKAEEGAMPS